MGILDKIKQDAQNSGQNKGKFFYVKDGEKRRIRFLQDMEDGIEVVMHDNYELQIKVPCQEIFDRDCEYCERDDLRTRVNYAWSVYDYDSNDVKVLMYPMNNCTPVGAIAAMYENYGTLLDRDYIIGVSGNGTNKAFSVIPMDKSKFRNEKAKPFSRSAFLKVLDKAYHNEGSDFEEDKQKKGSFKRKKDPKNDGFMNEPDPIDYSEMTPTQLYKLCEEREIEAEPKMKAKYYINLLEEYDEENLSDSADEDEDGGNDYSDMTAKELYQLCKKRGLDVLPKKPEKYYINLLEEDDGAHDDWENDEEDEEWDS